ncbi:unnamed protein product [Phyllotreta striolata]|uniref:Uracil-DNA glycosylase-like domain-containing protein n=1 Tax=Phyllotreta striolata TaxID=444603 RepID=A0A9N9XJX6_PHYSR|nr:unnamed protein product [Phyllotreta striolata]
MLKQKLNRIAPVEGNNETPENQIFAIESETSPYFNQTSSNRTAPEPDLSTSTSNIPETEQTCTENEGPQTFEDQILNLHKELTEGINSLDILPRLSPPIEYIYNPLDYAFNIYESYIRKYCKTTKKIVMVGLNPGAFGMCQTGVPFGDPKSVKQFLEIEGTVTKPELECPTRPILGFSSTRSEQSGQRLWKFFQSICGTADKFFAHAILFNFCPITLLLGTGLNVTPEEIKNIQVRNELESVCQDWYLKIIRLLQPEYILAIGKYVEKKTNVLFKTHSIDNIKVIYMPHPSPRVANNQNWPEKALKCLEDNDLLRYFRD